MMGRRQKLISGDEHDCVCRSCRRRHRGTSFKRVKRNLNRRERREERLKLHNTIYNDSEES